MGCSAAQARLNGAKSRGPKTKRGKVTSARNATKHGVLAKQPPLLISEDLASYDGLLQELVAQYQPSNPVEYFLVQQVAMGMLKQYRLWTVETAIANAKLLQSQKAIDYPDLTMSPQKEEYVSPYREQRLPRQKLLEAELLLLSMLGLNLRYDISCVEGMGVSKVMEALSKSLENYFHEQNQDEAVWQYHDEFDEWIDRALDDELAGGSTDFQDVVNRAQHLIELARQRIAEIEQTLEQMKAIDQQIQQAEADSQGIADPELFSRYQRQLNRELYEALDRLEAIQERKNKGSMGSFGQNA